MQNLFDIANILIYCIALLTTEPCLDAVREGLAGLLMPVKGLA